MGPLIAITFLMALFGTLAVIFGLLLWIANDRMKELERERDEWQGHYTEVFLHFGDLLSGLIRIRDDKFATASTGRRLARQAGEYIKTAELKAANRAKAE